MLERIFAAFVILTLLPVFLLLSFLIFLFSGGPIFFRQKRMGKNKKTFVLYKIRTMGRDAEKKREAYEQLNEADGPVFKIKDDPRYTNIGKLISRLGLDELPQLVNIIKGDMAFVGPRPLPVDEAKQIPDKYKERFSVLPGITSLWVVKGGHMVSFKEWMELDMYYVKNKSSWLDVVIAYKTMSMFGKTLIVYFLTK